MKRFCARVAPVLACVASLLWAGVGKASAWDAASGTVVLDAPASQRLGLDEAPKDWALTSYGGARQEGWTPKGALSSATYVDDAIEGRASLRLGASTLVVFENKALFSALSAGRVELRYFTKAVGTQASVRLVYGASSLQANDLYFPAASVLAVRTGRATSDGWQEFSTGAVDARFGTFMLSGLVVETTKVEQADAGALLDAMELRQAPGSRLSDAACTLKDEAQSCAPGAVCVSGRCTDSALVYGALPPPAHRRELVQRTHTYLTQMQGDRHSTANALATFLASTAGAVERATTPDMFFRPYLRAFYGVRGAHSAPPQPNELSSHSLWGGLYKRTSNNEFGACTGLVQRDLTSSTRGYAVFQASASGPLRVGDLLESIDDEPADAWIDRVAMDVGMMASDPDADQLVRAEGVLSLALQYARSLTLTRCRGSARCQGADAEAIRVDLDAARSQPRLQTRCSLRFRTSVTAPSGVDLEAYETVLAQTDAAGVATVLTNGEPGVADDSPYMNTLRAAFDARPTKMIVDKRLGGGGGGFPLIFWMQQVRQDHRFGLFWQDRYGYEAVDGPESWLTSLIQQCDTASPTAPFCQAYGGRWDRYEPRATPRPPKLAWLTVSAGSASDMALAYAKGVRGVRIFGPARSSGLFGGLHTMASFWPGFSGGSVQGADTRIGSTEADLRSSGFLSGRGVEPDERLVQTHSDLLAGKDTLLERAHAWLEEP